MFHFHVHSNYSFPRKIDGMFVCYLLKTSVLAFSSHSFMDNEWHSTSYARFKVGKPIKSEFLDETGILSIMFTKEL